MVAEGLQKILDIVLDNYGSIMLHKNLDKKFDEAKWTPLSRRLYILILLDKVRREKKNVKK